MQILKIYLTFLLPVKLEKRALIFDPEKGCMAISPEHLTDGSVDSEIPILAAFNG